MSSMYDIWDECYDRFKDAFGGDEMLTRCAATATGLTKSTVTTEEKGLHRASLSLIIYEAACGSDADGRDACRVRHSRGYDRGFARRHPHALATPVRLLLHSVPLLAHFSLSDSFLGGGWVHLFGYGSIHSDMDQIRRIRTAADFLGGDNMFQRYVFGDGKWLLTMGYSVSFYEKPLTREDMAAMVRPARTFGLPCFSTTSD